MATPEMNAGLTDLLTRIGVLLRDGLGSRVRQVYAHGSRVDGTASADSDLDLLVVLDGPVRPWEDQSRIVRLLYPLQLALDYPIHATAVARKDFERREYALFREVQDRGLVI